MAGNSTGDVPFLDTDQMIEVDRAMIEDYRIELIQMMENAGRCLAVLSRERFLGGRPEGKRITVMAGCGGNGGGALVAARRLHTWGAKVQVLLAQAEHRMTTVARHQLDILERMDVECIPEPEPQRIGRDPDLILDGLVGYSLKGAPYGVVHDLIKWCNATEAPVLALDTPSGLDTTTGSVFEPAIVATATMTLALPKEGLRGQDVEANVGELYLADIGVPPALYSRPALGLKVGPIFATSDIVRLA